METNKSFNVQHKIEHFFTCCIFLLKSPQKKNTKANQTFIRG